MPTGGKGGPLRHRFEAGSTQCLVHPEEACWEKMGWGAAPSLGGWEKHEVGRKRRKEEKAREEKGRDRGK